ncbi:MAG TPA: hypothetical protein VG942_09805 [Hyphomonadaceae bacterium]|nr:hypothetical protein [Hyphomonadaceae bacterium]
MDNQYGLVVRIACGQFDMTTLPKRDDVMVDQVIETDIAACDTQNGGTYAY